MWSWLLGSLFLLIQVSEFLAKSREIRPNQDAYASMFYAITGLHGAHVAAGLLLTMWTFARAAGGDYAPSRHVGVQVCALYWHFVHVMWILIFLALYVSPRWAG